MKSRRMYVMHSPSYVENHPSHSCGQVLIDDPLSEHFTYLYYNFLKYDLVDEVIIFPREGNHDKFRDDIPEKLDIGISGKSLSLNWDRDGMYDIVNDDPGSYVYFWSNLEECHKIKNSFVIFNPVIIATNRDNCLDSRYHHYGLLEGLNHEKTFRVIPEDIPYGFLPTTSNKFTELDVDSLQKTKKDYDWIIVSSTDPRKRHTEFLQALEKNPNFKNLRGCIAARNPDNKGRIFNGHYVLKHLMDHYANRTNNVDIILNVNNDLKVDLLSRTKIFVCTSTFDVGPRAVVEALQAGMPIFTMPHIGTSTWVEQGKNGELINNLDDSTTLFYEMLEKYQQGAYLQHAKIVAEKLKPEFVMPNIVNEIKKLSSLKFSN
jgi:glycosyltransferase involved in cell wall biosynthesis